MYHSMIKGVGSYVPPRVLKNDDLTQFMDTSDEWIRTRTGIEQRHWADDGVFNSDLGLQASLKALEAAKVSKEQIDLIIYATLSPDHDMPGSGCFLNAKLGIPGVPALDIRQACSGFIYGLSIADQFIKTGMYKNVLVVGSEIQSKGLDKSTEGREVTVLFGDGAGAAVVSRCDGEVKRGDSQIYSTHLYADGMNAKDLMIAAPGQQYPGQRITIEALQNKDQHPKMNGKVVFVNAVKRMPEALQTALDSSGFKIEDVDLFVFHQANIRINEMVAKQLGVPESKIFNTIHKYGNTTAATIPLGLSDAVQEGKLKKGMLVASAAFGAGFTWASAIYRW